MRYLIYTRQGNSYFVEANGDIVRNDIPGFKPSGQWRMLGLTFLRSWSVLMLPVIILGGIFSGVFTATESAVVAAFSWPFLLDQLGLYDSQRRKAIAEMLCEWEDIAIAIKRLRNPGERLTMEEVEEMLGLED